MANLHEILDNPVPYIRHHISLCKPKTFKSGVEFSLIYLPSYLESKAHEQEESQQKKEDREQPQLKGC